MASFGKWLTLFLIHIFVYTLSASGITQLNMQNLDVTLKSAQVVFVAFCADWCPFSRRLKPIFEEAANKWYQDNPQSSVVWAIVDSVQQADVADKYFVNKYPTMKVFINGELISKEYRSTRSVDALTAFVKEQLQVSINEFTSTEALDKLIDKTKRNVIAYYHSRDGPEYQNFQVLLLMQSKSIIIKLLPCCEKTFNGNFADYDFLKQWLTDKCIPLVREVTFENVEELTEEGLPFLIFFRDPVNKDGDKFFTELVMRELHDQKAGINALLADGHKFAHPLKHLGKSAKDLPVLAIDSFQHMFLFPDMNELPQPGKLRQFILDLHSGKLHKEFHETLDQKKKALEQLDENGARPPSTLPETTPPPSIFKELRPSEKRYSLLSKTEL
ncbi:Thioredoxin domain-containing protein [Aphelenchoides bicaudatus]|nr:Thioredoxin domain-containing protein [Aphelenchoides bicaudatus]